MASENPDDVLVEAPVVENDGGKEEPLESEFPKKLEIGEGSKERKSLPMWKKMIVLKSSDGEIFEIDEAVAVQSQTIAHIIEDGCATNEIPLANVTGEVLSKVIEYCRKHVGDDDSEFASDEVNEDLKKWDAEFMDMDQSMMFELILASSYLNANGLLDLVCQTVADMVAACKSVEEIREKFEIENDYTPEEEEEVRKENQWAFE